MGQVRNTVHASWRIETDRQAEESEGAARQIAMPVSVHLLICLAPVFESICAR